MQNFCPKKYPIVVWCSSNLIICRRKPKLTIFFFFFFKVTVDVKQNRCILVLLFPFSKYLFLTYAIYVVSYVEKKLYIILHTCIFQYYVSYMSNRYVLLACTTTSFYYDAKKTNMFCISIWTTIHQNHKSSFLRSTILFWPAKTKRFIKIFEIQHWKKNIMIFYV